MVGLLARKRVLITRAPEQSGRLRDALLAAGATPVVAPAIQILDPTDWAPLDGALERLAAFDWVLFTSQSAVERVSKRLAGRPLPPSLRIAAVGEATALHLREQGWPVHFIPADARAVGLIAELLPQLGPGTRLLLPRGDLADQRLPEALLAAGCIAECVITYRTAPATQPDPALIAECRQGLDWLLFTSGSTVTGLLALLGGQPPQALAPGVRIAVLGPETKRAAEAAGLTVDLVSPVMTVEALVAALDQTW